MKEITYTPGLALPASQVAGKPVIKVRQEIEILRLLSALGIVWLHAGVSALMWAIPV